jgi:hypothetical protein
MICTLDQTLSEDQIEENGIGRTCSRLGWDEKYIEMLFKNPERKGLFGRTKCR